jgi:DAK2 domain fusion protein YloV
VITQRESSAAASTLSRGRRLEVDVLDVLDAATVRRWAGEAARSLDAHRAEIDRLNVFPVHDSDTGTNLATTVRAALTALEADPTDDPAIALQSFARGAVLGASGNSGNILAQLLRGLADAAVAAPMCDAAVLRAGLRRGAAQARSAVAEPVEGTILTVADAAAAATDAESSLAELAAHALAAADDALRHTPEQLAALARAGVVDAGAQGLVLVLAALVSALGGNPPPAHAVAAPPDLLPHFEPETGPGSALEVQYLLDTPPGFGDAEADALRAHLLRLGDSVVVVGTGEGTWNVHVHTDDAGAAVEAGIAVGRPYRISVVPMTVPDAGPAAAPKPAALIALAAEPDLARMFRGEGAQVVDAAEPGVTDVLAAVFASGSGQLVLLPNDVAMTRLAEQAARAARDRGLRVAVIPTRSPVQGLAAVAVHDPSRRFDDDVVAMAEAAAATRVAEVVIAERESLTSAGICQAGDVLGLIDGEVVEIGRGELAVALAVSDRLLGVGPELMTVLVAAPAQTGVGDVLRRHVRERSPLTEVTVYNVGRLSARLIIGVE